MAARIVEFVEFVNLFFAGLLAGMEFVVRFGVRGPLAALEERAQLQLRQALIRTLRVVVPAAYLPTIVSGVVVTALYGTGAGAGAGANSGIALGFRCAAVLAMVVWTLATFGGTVPINAAVLDWQPGALPQNWRELIRRWERLDTVRTWAAVAAFACFLVAASQR
ncbi:putative membrane protein [Kitasatospora sp. MAP12-15]|uniref:anthrone oxygenase family protein n=1 Tax=unclassified Kitasatospora TaxID=2633591 RepID=UPI002476A5F2|nr:anthrone oxygenase family protein [Kitasatospora sp. MAP12-44]MDH6115141.1 putative membrane protein [Kitasatospora sp. MAP12-44]